MASTDVPSAAAAVEAASLAFLNATTAQERSTAEAALLEMRRWPQPLPLCHHLLVHSTVGYAKLQALYMARECLGAQWHALTPAERGELQNLFLRLQTDGAEQYVRAAAAQMLAVHAKHDVLHTPPPPVGSSSTPPDAAIAALLHSATQMLEDPSAARAPAAIDLLHALLGEFGAPSSGAAGGSLAWSMHARARASFQEHHLLPVFQIGLRHLQRLAEPAVTAPPPLAPPLVKSLTLCASLLTMSLSWDFDGVGEAAAATDTRPGLNASVVRPPASNGASWRAVLGHSGLLAAVGATEAHPVPRSPIVLSAQISHVLSAQISH